MAGEARPKGAVFESRQIRLDRGDLREARDNGLNQYLNWSGTPINHDGNGGVIQEGWISASYNALNQPVSISSPHSNGTMWFAYDPLGRCVKRWIGPSGAATSNPATYLYYDGWNLIQEADRRRNMTTGLT